MREKVLKIIKKSFIIVIVFTFGFILTGCEDTNNNGLTKVVVADANSTHHLNLYVAKEKKIFEKYGLEVKIIQTDGPAQAVSGGNADIFFACPTSVMSSIGASVDKNITSPLIIIAQVKIPCTSVLVIPIGSDIKTPIDLQGKKIAGLSPTCCAVIAIRDALKEQYNVEFELQSLGAGPSLAALEAGTVAGAILEEPFVQTALLKKDANGNALYKTIFDGSTTGGENLAGENPPCRTINANSTFLANNIDTVKEFIKAIDEANGYILEQPSSEEIVTIAQKYVPNVTKEAIELSNPKLGFTTKLDTEGLITYAHALHKQQKFTTTPGEWLFANELEGITWNKKTTTITTSESSSDNKSHHNASSGDIPEDKVDNNDGNCH